MDLASFFTDFSGQGFINIFFKAFAILFALMYLIYAIVIGKQAQVMNSTLRVNSAGTFSLVSLIQILVGVGLLLLAIFFV